MVVFVGLDVVAAAIIVFVLPDGGDIKVVAEEADILKLKLSFDYYRVAWSFCRCLCPTLKHRNIGRVN